MTTRPAHAGQTITDDDASIAAALEDVSIPTLLLSLVHMTGDSSYIRGKLKPQGLFLNHGITRMRHWKHTPQWDYLIENVFPGGDLTHISHLTETMEDEHFDILDVENLRPHYARTCALWAARLKKNESQSAALVGKKTCRIWLLYLAASAVAFEEGSIHLHQTLAAKTMQNATTTPTSRENTYRDWPRWRDTNRS